MRTEAAILPSGLARASSSDRGLRSRASMFGAFASRVIADVGTSAFPDHLIESLIDIVDFDLFCFTLFPKAGSPLLLHHNLLKYTSASVLDDYCRNAYTLDAVYDACRSGVGDGLYFFPEIDGHRHRLAAGDEVLHPCVSLEANSLAGEITYITHLPSFSLVFSLMRSPKLSCFADQEIAMMASLEPIVRSSLSRQFSHLSTPARSLHHLDAKALDKALLDFAHHSLSFRELAVVKLILHGHTSLSIGHHLGISEGTVKNHRKSVYRKLRIGSQAELFLKFFDLLSK